MALTRTGPPPMPDTPPMTRVDESAPPARTAPAPGRAPKPRRRRKPGWLARKPRPAKVQRPVPPPPAPGEPGAVLRFARKLALWAVALVVTAASGAAFAESYRGLLTWAQHHLYTGVWATVFPLQVDTFILVGEIALFIATVDRWRPQSRAGAWASAITGLAVSVAGNIGHVGAHDLQSRATAAVPPVAAFAGLWLGLFILKQVIAHAPAGVTTSRRLEDTEDVPEITLAPAIRDAAKVAYVASVAIGNPFSDRGLSARFGISRPAAAQIRAEVVAGPAIPGIESTFIPEDEEAAS